MDQYRSPINDALGRMIPDQGPLRLWLDDDTTDRAAPEGWVHLISAREVCFLLQSGRVTEISLDSDLSDDLRFGQGKQVVDFIVANNFAHWPEEGLSIHSANPSAREQMRTALLLNGSRLGEIEETIVAGQPKFTFTAA